MYFHEPAWLMAIVLVLCFVSQIVENEISNSEAFE